MGVRTLPKKSDTDRICFSLDPDVEVRPDTPTSWLPVSQCKAVGPGADVAEVGVLSEKQQEICRELAQTQGEAASRYKFCEFGIRAVRVMKGEREFYNRSPAVISEWIDHCAPVAMTYLWLYILCVTHGIDPQEKFREFSEETEGNSQPLEGGQASDSSDSPSS